MRNLAVAILACAIVGCHKAPETTHAIDPALASCVPPDAGLIAGVDLGALRASPLYSKLPSAATTFAAQIGGVSTAVVSYNGKELLVAARGRFQTPPPGVTMLAPDLALLGSPQETAVAAAQYKAGGIGAAALLEQAEPVAAGAQLWIAARGGASLPLTGNAANLAGVLRRASFVTVTARTGTGLALELRATAPDAGAARAIEETLRADFTLGAAGESKREDVAATLRSAQVTRAGREVRVSLTVSNEVAGRLFELF
jgi:hypothetical protein